MHLDMSSFLLMFSSIILFLPYPQAKLLSKSSGACVPVPPPPRSSARFVACGACGDHVAADAFCVRCLRCHQWSHVREGEQQYGWHCAM